MQDLTTEKLFTADDVKLTERSHYELAQRDFVHYRKLVRPNLIQCWWQERVGTELTLFYQDLKAGRRPKVVLGAPPQHGKSDMMKDFCCWVAGNEPGWKTIFGSYADELGISANLHMQRMLTGNEMHRKIFPNTRLAEPGESTGGRERRTTTFLEFINTGGCFRNTTVDGKINGFGLDLGVIDDPIKGRQEAQSKLIRDKTWNWLTDDFFSRFSDRAGLVMIMTRWHVDDPVGRWMEHFPKTRVLNFPAIAERDDKNRRKGEALFPEHKSIEFLLERKRSLTEASWQSLYQQHPIIVGGGIFPIEKIKPLSILDRTAIAKSVRYWDKAGTEDDGACTAGVLMHQTRDKRYVIEHVVTGQWGSLDREEKIKFWAQRDRSNLNAGMYEVVVEQEPGSGGKESAENTIRNLAGFRAYADKVTGDKVVRAEPFAAQVQNGNVYMVAGQWQVEYLDEMECFPQGKRRDQIDASSGAFNRLVAGPAYDLFGGAFD